MLIYILHYQAYRLAKHANKLMITFATLSQLILRLYHHSANPSPYMSFSRCQLSPTNITSTVLILAVLVLALSATTNLVCCPKSSTCRVRCGAQFTDHHTGTSTHVEPMHISPADNFLEQHTCMHADAVALQVVQSQACGQCKHACAATH